MPLAAQASAHNFAVSARTALADNFNTLTKNDGGVAALSKLLGLGSSTIQNIRKGGNVELATIERVAEHYGVEVQLLLLPNLGRDGIAFESLSAHEAELVTHYRHIRDPIRKMDLIARANAFATEGDAAASTANPFRGKRPAEAADSEPMPLDGARRR